MTSRARRQETKTGHGARFYLGGVESTGDPGERVTKQRGMRREALIMVRGSACAHGKLHGSIKWRRAEPCGTEGEAADVILDERRFLI